MSEILETVDRIPIDTTGFRIPCRRFSFALNVSRDRRVPVVDEFVLRILRVFERTPVRRLRLFFGFSSQEMEIVLRDLVARGQVEVDGDYIFLHPSAEELFVQSEDDVPRIVSIENWNETVSFDMVAGTILRGESPYATRHLVELKPATAAKEIPTDFARAAFQSNFRDYVRNLKGLHDADSVNLYSIANVEIGGYGWASYSTTDYLYLKDDVVVDTDYGVKPDKFVALKPLIQAMSVARADLPQEVADGQAAAVIDGLFGDTRFSDFLSNQNFFDIRSWMERERHSVGMQDGTRPIVGSLYLPENIEAFAALNRTVPSEIVDGSNSILWFRPAGSGWGVTSDLLAAVGKLKDAVAMNGRKTFTELVDLHGMPIESVRRFRNIFDRARTLRSRNIPRSIELVRLANAVAISVRIGINSTQSVPVGYLSVDPSVLQKLEKNMGLEDRVRRSSMVWQEPERK